MNTRTTAIIGAGAVLDFDFNGIEIPSTANITKICTDKTIKGFYEEEIDLIKQIYDKIVDVEKVELSRLFPKVRNFKPNITFEDLFEVIETLHSYNRTWKHEHLPISLISALVSSDIHFESIEYYRALEEIVKTIIEVVYAYDKKFRLDDNELWYKKFWNRFNGQIDIFIFNYDTTIEYSLEEYNDGFVKFSKDYKRFEPDVLWNADGTIPTLNHLHGCILYADVHPKQVEFNYNHRDLYKLNSIDEKGFLISHQWMPKNQVGDSIFYTPIITGLKKMDKLCYMPHSIYHANFVKKIIENPSLLICGYSFGDLYANQLLERHKLLHLKNQRIVLIDKWPDYVKDQVSLYRYYMDNTSEGFKEFVSRAIEGGISPLDTFKQFTHVSTGCWQSPNGSLRLYTNGMKNAIVNHMNDILEFLQKRTS